MISEYKKSLLKNPTSKDDRKKNAEVLTPIELVIEMISKLPDNFYKKDIKILDPCVGKGVFMVVMYDELIKRGYTRKQILTEILYFADINPVNIFITKMILDPYNEFELNYYIGDSLSMTFDFKFYLVLGNPPYNASGNTGTGNTIWQHFVKLSLTKWLLENGYLCMVHPSGWRKPNTKKGKFYGMYELMAKTNQMLYLSIHDIKDGKKTFNAGTRYDWYVISKSKNIQNTTIRDDQGKMHNTDMIKFDWLPNYNIDGIQKIIAVDGEEKCNIIYNRSNYGADKKWMSDKKDEKFKYPCVHSTPKSGTRYMYSSKNDNGHFDVPKVIFGESGIYNPIIDIFGKYGITHGAMSIKIDNLEEGNMISKAIISDEFQDIIKSCMFSSFRIDWNIFTYFKKDFWKEFI